MQTFVLILVISGYVNTGWGNGPIRNSASYEFTTMAHCQKALLKAEEQEGIKGFCTEK